MRFACVLVVCAVGCSLDRSGLLTSRADASVETESPLDATEIDSTTPEPDTSTTADDGTSEEDAAIDAAPLLPGCVEGLFGGHSYLFCERDANWDQARTTCMFAGLDLAIIGSAAENDFLKASIDPAKSGDWYIGLNDRVKEGDYVWVDGSAASYTHWAWLQPDNFFDEDCTVIKRGGDWNDVDCVDSPANAFICEEK